MSAVNQPSRLIWSHIKSKHEKTNVQKWMIFFGKAGGGAFDQKLVTLSLG